MLSFAFALIASISAFGGLTAPAPSFVARLQFSQVLPALPLQPRFPIQAKKHGASEGCISGKQSLTPLLNKFEAVSSLRPWSPGAE